MAVCLSDTHPESEAHTSVPLRYHVAPSVPCHGRLTRARKEVRWSCFCPHDARVNRRNANQHIKPLLYHTTARPEAQYQSCARRRSTSPATRSQLLRCLPVRLVHHCPTKTTSPVEKLSIVENALDSVRPELDITVATGRDLLGWPHCAPQHQQDRVGIENHLAHHGGTRRHGRSNSAAARPETSAKWWLSTSACWSTT